MGQIGNENETISPVAIQSNFIYASGPYTATESGQVNSLEISRPVDSPISRMVLGVYEDNGGSPGSLVGQSVELVGVESGFNSVLPLQAFSLTAGASYWISYTVDTSTGAAGGIRRHSLPGVSLTFQGGYTYSADMPASFPASPQTLAGFADPVLVSFGLGGVLAGELQISSVSDQTISLKINEPATGSSPFSYSFHVGALPDFVPGSTNQLGAPSASATAVDSGVENGSLRFYKCVTTDSAGVQQTSSTAVGVAAGSKKWLLIGDSFGQFVWDGTQTVMDEFAMGNQLADMMTALDPSSVIHSVANRAVSGASASEWVASHLTPAMAAAPAINYPNVIIVLGLNDTFEGASPDQYKASMQTIISNLRNSGYGDIVIGYPPFVNWGTIDTELEQSRLVLYAERIDELAVENPNTFVARGLLSHSPNNLLDFGESENDIHPTPRGGVHLAALLASEVVAATTPSVGVDVSGLADQLAARVAELSHTPADVVQAMRDSASDFKADVAPVLSEVRKVPRSATEQDGGAENRRTLSPASGESEALETIE